MTKNDAYNVVTDRIIEALEKGIVPWHRPWKSVNGGGPISLATGKPYRGMNVFILETTAALNGYTSPYWTTFKQAKERGGAVRKGEKGTPVVLWKPIKASEEQRSEGKKDFMLMRYFTVFNVEQCDGIEVPELEPLPEHDPIESCETIAAGYTAVEVKHGGDRAYYSPVLDYVGMPIIGAFDTPEHYYGTLFHELAHSTGHESRLNRKFGGSFGSEDYGQEELVAEMAAAFLCGDAGIEVNVEHHAGYLASWLKVLNDDRKMIVQAAGQAQRAADLVLGRKYEKEEASSDASPLVSHSTRRKHEALRTAQRLRLGAPRRRHRGAASRQLPRARSA